MICRKLRLYCCNALSYYRIWMICRQIRLHCYNALLYCRKWMIYRQFHLYCCNALSYYRTWMICQAIDHYFRNNKMFEQIRLLRLRGQVLRSKVFSFCFFPFVKVKGYSSNSLPEKYAFLHQNVKKIKKKHTIFCCRMLSRKIRAVIYSYRTDSGRILYTHLPLTKVAQARPFA